MKKKILPLLLALFSFGAANAQCTALFSANPSFLNNGNVAFTDSAMVSGGSTWSYIWSFGDGTYGGYNGIIHNYAATGTYYVCLTVVDSSTTATCSYCDSVHVINNSLPTCTAYYFHSDSSSTINFYNSSSGAGLTSLWDLGDGTTGTFPSSFTHNYAPGTYIACLTVTNAGATCTDTYCDTITVLSCGASFVSVVDSSGINYSFTSSLTGTADTYYWSFGDGTHSTLANPGHTYAGTGSYNVCLLVSSSTDTSCSYSTCQYIYANTGCNAYFNYYDSLGYTYFYSNAALAGLTYLWTFGDGGIDSVSGSGVAHVYASPGMYYACLTVTNSAAGCNDTYCDSIAIVSCGGGFISNVDTTGMGYNFTSWVMGTADTYTWTFGDGGTSTAANPSHTYASPGNYNVCLTLTSSIDTSCSQTTCQNVSPSNGCNANFFIIQDSSNLYNYWVYNYGYGIAGSTVSYLWDFGDSTTSVLPYPSHTYGWSGPFYICLTITSTSVIGTLCTATHCDSIFPGHNPANVVTLNVINPATVAVHDIATNVESLTNYPNPFDNTTVVSYSIIENSPVELIVLDLLGNKVAVLENATKQSGKHNVSFDASGISAGIYLLQLRTNTKVITKKLCVSR